MRTARFGYTRLAATPYPWTSSQRAVDGDTKILLYTCPSNVAAGVGDEALISPGRGTSVFEEVLQQLPIDARSQLAGALIYGRGVCSSSQPALAAGRLSCKALRRVIDDGLQSLRLNVLPDTDQGPAPSLSNFPNVTSLTLSIDAVWAKPKADCSRSHFAHEQPVPNLDFRSDARAYPPSLLLGPLQGQPLASLRRLRKLTLVGQVASFEALCKQLRAAYRACGALSGPRTESETSRSGDDSESIHESDSSDLYDTSGGSAGAGCTANAAGSGERGSGRAGGGGSCCLEHLDLGTVRFPLASAGSESVVRAHAALGPLGLRELTLGVELLPGVQAHKGLRRLHVYNSMRGGTAGAVPQSHFAGLRHMPLVHVGLLGRGWTRESMQHVLLQLPDTVTCISLAGEARVAIKLGQDDQGKPTRELLFGDNAAEVTAEAVRTLSTWPRALPRAARITLVHMQGLHVATPDTMQHLNPLLSRAERVECGTLSLKSEHVAAVLPALRTVPRQTVLEVPNAALLRSPLYTGLRVSAAEGPAGGAGAGAGEGPADGMDGGARGGTKRPVGRVLANTRPLPSVQNVFVRAVEMLAERAQEREGQQQQQQQQQQDSSRRVTLPRWSDPKLNDTCGFAGGEWLTELLRRGSHLPCSDEHRAVVFLLHGPGVSALGAHSTAEGRAALEGALGELSRSRPGNHSIRRYVVFPGGRGMLLRWDGEGIAAAAATAAAAAVDSSAVAEAEAAEAEAAEAKETEAAATTAVRNAVTTEAAAAAAHKAEACETVMAGQAVDGTKAVAEAAAAAVRRAAAAALAAGSGAAAAAAAGPSTAVAPTTNGAAMAADGGVRVVVLPHKFLLTAQLGLNFCIQQLVESEVRLYGDCCTEAVGQLQAVVELWRQLQAQWDNPGCHAAGPVHRPGPGMP